MGKTPRLQYHIEMQWFRESRSIHVPGRWEAQRGTLHHWSMAAVREQFFHRFPWLRCIEKGADGWYTSTDLKWRYRIIRR